MVFFKVIMPKVLQTKKIKIIAGLVIILLIASGLILYNNRANQQAELTSVEEQSELNVDYAPPTDEEKQQAEDNKSRLVVGDKDQTPPSSTNKAPVTPEITFAEVSDDLVEVGSYVPSIFENNGNCTVIFTKSTLSVTRKVYSVAEGRSTYCPIVKIPLDQFSEKGVWQVKVTYDSDVYKGVSAERSIEVR
jgi:hypothetical protein